MSSILAFLALLISCTFVADSRSIWDGNFLSRAVIRPPLHRPSADASMLRNVKHLSKGSNGCSIASLNACLSNVPEDGTDPDFCRNVGPALDCITKVYHVCLREDAPEAMQVLGTHDTAALNDKQTEFCD